jgi:hypothetical protein
MMMMMMMMMTMMMMMNMQRTMTSVAGAVRRKWLVPCIAWHPFQEHLQVMWHLSCLLKATALLLLHKERLFCHSDVQDATQSNYVLPG